ncbi:MAG: cytochrome c5 [Gammaproteobacteria bacterium]
MGGDLFKIFNDFWDLKDSVTSFGLIILLSTAGLMTVQAQPSDTDHYRNMLIKYCVACHNETLKTANLMLDRANINNISEDPALWEKVVTKLTLRAMPQVGFPLRPSEDEYKDMLAYLTGELDRIAEEDINPGRPTVHRLNRTEYTNAIRDLLDLEIDGAKLLPPDNVDVGFDNIADALSVSPLLMEQYMFAANRVTQLAVGPDSMRPASETYDVAEEFMQESQTTDDLPFGSRGGTVFQHYFPLDGEYTIRGRLTRNEEGYIRGLREQSYMDFRLDHKRIDVLTIGGEVHGRSGPLFTNNAIVDYAGDPDQIGYEFSADKDLEVRVNVKAGSHTVGVTFLDDFAKKSGVKSPKLTLTDITNYKGGKPAILNVTVTGPFNAKESPDTPSRKKIFACQPTNTADEVCPQTILSRLAHLAYRRPVTELEIDSLLRLYRTGRDQDGFESGIELALQSILTGPEFLFRVEQDPPGASSGDAQPVADIDLASRLSFFLWSSIPDEELLNVAESGQLRQPTVLKQQVQRMIADPRFDALLDNFGSQWLAIRNLDIVEPQTAIFVTFDGELRSAMKRELALWFESMVRQDSNIVDMLTSDYTYVNGRLAEHYGIPEIYGDNFRRVTLDNPMRRGILGKAGFLTITSFSNRTSPVVRGNWVLANMLNMETPPAPADAFEPELQVENKEGKALTMKESMIAHRQNPVCANCHKMMEPIGLALENFDAIGAYRERYIEADAVVDTSGTLFDNQDFKDTLEFQDSLLRHSDRFVETVTSKLLTYALGRGLEYYDQPEIRKIVKKAAEDNYTWSSVLLGIIESTPFQYRRL